MSEAQYLILRIAQSALHFTFPTDLFNQPPSQLFWETSSHMLQLMREGCSYTQPPLSIARYSCIQYERQIVTMTRKLNIILANVFHSHISNRIGADVVVSIASSEVL